ncbi:ABC transporter permease [Hydrogenobacter thermophilus]|uniref:ABC transporter permease n=1 Tax=Hydrogenobacter thermophilus TaxID=940 RepID=UPI0030F9DB96
MMGIYDLFWMSIRSFRANKLRSFLTTLGIVIGVSAVIAMLSVGEGASRKIQEQIASIGSNLLIVLPGSTTAGGVRMGLGTQPTLSLTDAQAVVRECPSVLRVAPIKAGVAQLVYGSMNWSTGVVGTTQDYFEIRDWKVVSGRVFGEEDVRSASKVAVLGQTVVENLFVGDDPVGKVIRIKGMPFTVIGVLERKGQSPMGQDQDDTVIVPISSAQRFLFGTAFPGQIDRMMVQALGPNSIEDAEKEVKQTILQRHRQEDFTVRNLSQFLQVQQESARVMSLLLLSVACVSLLVGGIGIMNIMLVSVAERTREIGIRMAVGARVWDIRGQFLLEALILSTLGGMVGIAVGVIASYSISRAFGWAVVISPFHILVAFSFSFLVGVIFGFYPAYKASKLNPVDALRYE